MFSRQLPASAFLLLLLFPLPGAPWAVLVLMPSLSPLPGLLLIGYLHSPMNKSCDGVGWDGVTKPAGAGEVASGDSQDQIGQGCCRSGMLYLCICISFQDRGVESPGLKAKGGCCQRPVPPACYPKQMDVVAVTLASRWVFS